MLLPGVGELGEFEPGTVEGADDPGLVVPGDVDEPAGGVDVPGVGVWPALLPPPAGDVPPAGALCATTHVAHKKSNDRKVSFVTDIGKPPWAKFLIPFMAWARSFKESICQGVCAKGHRHPIGGMW